MDLFMPAERVLYDRSYYFSDEAVDDYNEYIADRDGVNVDVVPTASGRRSSTSARSPAPLTIPIR